MKKVVILSGAGISAESWISTFRDNGGLWEHYDVMDVASPPGWKKNPALVLLSPGATNVPLMKCAPFVGRI